MQIWVKRGLAALLVIAVIALGIRYHRQILDLLANQAAVEAWLQQLGPLGPLGVIFLNALQVVIAMIPGYVMQLVAGYLYGWPWGAIYATIGMLIGGFIAVGLARIFGRPLVIRMVSEKRLDRWEEVAHLDSLPIWFILMLAPFGDVPYYIAGLTSLAIWKIIAIAAFVRTPSVILAVLIGSGALSWRSPWVLGTGAVMVIAALIALRYQNQIESWVDRTLLPWTLRLINRRAAIQPAAEGHENDPSTP